MNDSTKLPPENNFPSGYVPPKKWQWINENSGGRFAAINRPTAGSTHEQDLPVGEHPLQLYSLATPNGVKITLLLEELLELGCKDAEYDAWLIDIMNGDQFGSGFVAINPNSKIPAMLDNKPLGGGTPIRVFESGSILIYLAEKFGRFIPTDPPDRTETINWLMWQMGSAPFLGGGFGHFYAYAPIKIQYAIDRFAMEVKRQLDVLDRHLSENRFMVGDHYTIADMAIWPWYGRLAMNGAYDDSGKFLDTESYKHVMRWTDEIKSRPAAKRAGMVNRNFGPPETQLHERHSASDFDMHTQDKRAQNESKGLDNS